MFGQNNIQLPTCTLILSRDTNMKMKPTIWIIYGNIVVYLDQYSIF